MEIVVHIGAHKTASTYIQTRLERNVVPLERHNIGYAYPKTLRPMFATAPRRDHAISRVARGSARAWVLRNLFDNARDMRRERLLISEEQLIGSLRPIMSGRGFYQDAGRELKPLFRALQGQPVKVLLAVRSYESFFVSAYGQVLNGWKYMPFEQDLRETLLRDGRGWPELAAEVMEALPPDSTLRFWCYEQFAEVEGAVFEELIGPDAAGELSRVPGKPVPGPSQKAIDEIMAMAERGEDLGPETIRRTMRLFGKDKGFAGFNPWAPEERTRLKERYLRDLEMMCQLWPGSFMTVGLGDVSAPSSGTTRPGHQSGVSM
ncbi:MAG: hypothetical protein AAF293_08485 [Pseudomonadota bacterium]